MEEKCWRRNPGRETLEEEPSRRNSEGGILKEHSQRRNPRGGILEDESWRRNPEGGILEEESFRGPLDSHWEALEEALEAPGTPLEPSGALSGLRDKVY